MKKIILGVILIILLIVVFFMQREKVSSPEIDTEIQSTTTTATVTKSNINPIPKEPTPNPRNEVSVMEICGHSFKVQDYKVENINVANRIVDLVNNEYSVAKKKDETSCYWFNENINKGVSDDLMITTVSELSDSFVVQIISADSASFYLGEGFIIDKPSYDIYNMNAFDSERGRMIGNLKI